jgi:hypothetical protein
MWQSREGMRGGETGSAEGEEDLETIAEVVDETSGARSGEVKVEPSGEDILREEQDRPPDLPHNRG